MDFENKVPEWKATGVEPPESLKTGGFTSGYKPPAVYFNWFWHGVSACLSEIREKLSGHAADKNNPHGVTKAQIGLSNVDNTADSAKRVAYASSAANADKVAKNFLLRLNGGNVENSTLYTYNGATAKEVNITADKIGAVDKNLSNVDDAAFRDKASGAGVGGIPVVTATSANGVSYTASVPGVTSLYNGLLVTIIPDRVSASTSITLNVNGIGAKMVRLPLSFNNAAMSSPRLTTYFTEGRPITLQYDANYLSNDGAWKVFGKQRTSAQDLYGVTPVESGGTGADNAKEALTNLGVIYSATEPTYVEGRIWLKPL